jgi:Xaa-Pro dipeptidase
MNIEKLFDLVGNAEGILIYNGGEINSDPSFFYFTQLTRGLFEGSYVYLTRKKLTVITSHLEEQTARAEGLDVLVFENSNNLKEILKEITSDVTFLGVNYEGLTHKDFLNLKDVLPDKEFIDVGDYIMELRQIKSEREISKIQESSKIVSEVADMIPDMLKEGMTENELAAEVNYQMMKHGASSPSFDTIAAFGPDTAEPHFTGGNRKLKKGEVVLVDFGAKYQRYCSDLTRTYFFGKPPEEMIDIYNTVLEAQKEGIKAIKEGVNGKEVDRTARKVIDSTKYKGRFIHSLGHGLGLNVHDHPALGPNYDFVLKENMVVTVEPGIYIPDFGGVRIEDDVVVKKNGSQVLTKAKKDLIIV